MQENLMIGRRELVRGAAIAGATALVGFAGAQASAFANEATEKAAASVAVQKPQSGARPDAQYGFLVRTDRCVDCESCVAACREANHTPEGVKARRKVERYRKANGEEVYISSSCMHCENPACAQVCPAGAISKDEGGIVKVDHDLCIGCKYCYQACPFGVPRYVAGIGMDKCDCCQEAGVALGGTPNCVNACKFRALYYGPIDELQHAFGDRAKAIECSTGPSMLVI